MGWDGMGWISGVSITIYAGRRGWVSSLMALREEWAMIFRKSACACIR